jgi:very-short-patch-repair endonuclease
MSQAPNEAVTKPSKSQQSDSVAKGLENLRRRLLDLTNRNKLISFRHSKSSIRIVDVDFERTYASLLDERKLPFVHVPEPDREYIAEAGEKPSAKDFAEHLGWATSLDLAKNGGQANSFPVLQYQDDFELLVRKIGTTARTAIEESGVNLLHLVFGFLEWRESDDSTQIRQAPLVVVPVSLLTPKARDQDRSIRLQYTGEDLSTNLSLVEKMRKDFGIEIPYLDEGETPEQYFARFEPILRQKSSWRICRQVSLALLSFGRLLMYLDLDPGRWTSSKPLLQHPRLVDILSASSGEALSFATEFNIDEEETQSAPMPLVCDADSSQHSALIDAIRGKNLVIEGPPGTGKSQTITNLIAAAIADGKRVLFIAEKMAALEVVKRRLDAFGLGDFCLELHSHKTSKLGLLQSLDERIRATGRFSEPFGLGQKQQLLAGKRVDLTKYVSLLNTPYACTAKTPFELIWQRDSLRDVVPSKLHEVATITFQDAFIWDHQELQARKDIVSTYAAHLRRMVDAGGQIERTRDPWSWLSGTNFTISRREQLLTVLPTLVALYSKRVSLIGAFSRQFSNLHADLGDWFAVLDQCFGGATVTNTTTADLTELSKSADSWRVATGSLDAECPYDLLSVLSDRRKYAAVEHFTASVQRYHSFPSQLPGGGKKLLESAIDSEFRRDDEAVQGFGLTDYSLATLGELGEALARSERYIALLKRTHLELSQGLGVQESFTLKCMRDILAARELIANAPLHLSHLRGSQFAKDGLLHILELGQQKSAELRKEMESLAEHFVIDTPTTPDYLIKSATALETTPWYLRLGKQYRHAASLYRSVCSTSIERTRSQKVTCLCLLAHSRMKMDLFSSAHEYRSALGDNFSGLTTSWGDLIVTAKWHEDLFARLPEHQVFASEVRSALLTLPAARLKSLLATTTASQDIEDALSSLGDLHSRVPKLNFDEVDPEKFLAQIRLLVAASAVMLKTLEPLNLPASSSRTEIAAFFDSLKAARLLRDSLQASSEASSILGGHFNGAATSVNAIIRALSTVRSIQESALPKEVQSWVLCEEFPTRIQWLLTWIEESRENNAAIAAAEHSLEGVVGSQLPFPSRTSVPRLERAATAFERCLQSKALLPIWADAQRCARELRALGLDPIVSLCLEGDLHYDQLPRAFEYLFCDSLLRLLFGQQPHLWHLSGVTHEELRSQFASLDTSVIKLNRQVVAHRASHRPIPPGVRGSVVKETTELALIQHEIPKQRAHIPIRQLMLRAGRAIQGLKPCFMMSPMSVAQFLAPGRLTFDLIVMDEASQLRPEEAVGAIARATQLVVVGDPKQLPPTSFFQRTLDDSAEEEEERTAAEDAESILDVTLRRYQPVRRLRWHYRSQHHSLIAFSNSEFYGNDLIVFPSAYHDHPDLGVKYIGIEGRYENRRNPLEAERVVDAILEHIMLFPSESLGVVTMNFEQRELIEELLDMRLKGEAFSSGWIEARENTAEPFFIKNLENVQGDERDVVFISVTYGPDSQGNLYQRFAGVNTRSGHRRLNVLVTRSRKRTVLFSSLDPDLINAQPSTPWGVRALKAYMHFAKSGIAVAPVISPGAEPSNEHEAAVGSVLKAHGYEVVPQVGVSGYYIDLAIRHPKKPGAFLLGVEFDGKSYHSGRSARDRDRLREMTLVSQGWKLHRIWSTDWFKNRDAEIERLLQRVRSLEMS